MKILEMLSDNSRIPTIEIAKATAISANAVKYRISNMINKKIIIGFRLKLNTAILGYEHYKVFLMLKDITKEKIDKLIGYLKLEPNVIYITKAIGVSDLEFEVMLKNRSELHKMLREIRIKILRYNQTI